MQKFLGHSNVSTTADIYAHTLDGGSNATYFLAAQGA
jgi:integrase